MLAANSFDGNLSGDSKVKNNSYRGQIMRIGFTISVFIAMFNALPAQTIVNVPKNNAKRIVEAIQAKKSKSMSDQQLYFLALYHSGDMIKAKDFFDGMDQKILGETIKIVYIRCLLDMGLAREAYRQIKKLENPKVPNLELDFLKGKCLVKLKEWNAARMVLNLVLRVNPKHAEAHYYYALTCPAVRKYSEAIQHCRRVWELEERDSALAKKASAIMWIAMNHPSMKK